MNNTRNYMKELESMSVEELEERIRTNKMRLIYNNGFLLIITITSIIVCPIAVAPIALITVFRNYNLIHNTKEVQKTLEYKKDK